MTQVFAPGDLSAPSAGGLRTSLFLCEVGGCLPTVCRQTSDVPVKSKPYLFTPAACLLYLAVVKRFAASGWATAEESQWTEITSLAAAQTSEIVRGWPSVAQAYLSSVSRAVTLVCRASLSSCCSSRSLRAFFFCVSILSSSVSPSSTCLFRAFTLRRSCKMESGFRGSAVFQVRCWNPDGCEYLVFLLSVRVPLLVQGHVELF